MTISRSDTIYREHGLGVYAARAAIKLLSIPTTRGLLSPLFKNANVTDAFVVGSCLLSIAFALAVNFLSPGWLILVALLAAWRIYDMTCNHVFTLVVDRSDAKDPGYRSAVRSFALAGFNIVELICASFLIEAQFLTSGRLSCLFHKPASGREVFDAKAIFIDNLYNATSLSSIDPACASESTLATAFSIGFTIAFCIVVLLVVARAIATIPFPVRPFQEPAPAAEEPAASGPEKTALEVPGSQPKPGPDQAQA